MIGGRDMVSTMTSVEMSEDIGKLCRLYPRPVLQRFGRIEDTRMRSPGETARHDDKRLLTAAIVMLKNPFASNYTVSTGRGEKRN